MKAIGVRAAAVGLAALLVWMAGCSGSGSDDSGSNGSGSGSAMFIATCSLGCGGGQSSSEVTCSIVDIPINADIYAVFSQPVDPNSVNDQSFNVKDQITSAQPPGTLFVDPNNSRRVVFRPAIEFVNGTPAFGMNPTATYKVTIAADNGTDPGPFITSTGGKRNQSLMRCSVKPNQGVTDPVAGPPTVDVLVSVALVTPPVTPADVVHNQPADGATNVWRDSLIRFVFNDVMNPASVLDESSGQPPANGIKIKFDVDGDIKTALDQVELPGDYTLEAPDLGLLRTVMTFEPAAGLPSAGIDLRKVVIELPPTVTDLVGNSVDSESQLTFTPEIVVFADVTLPDADGENFAGTGNLDAANSGATWGAGRLQRGIGGGSGRLGALRITTGQTVTLNTDNQTFPLPGYPADIMVDVPLGVDPTFVVTNGIFEFSSILVEPGGTLVLEGTKPARLFSRGPIDIQAFAIVDLSGNSPAVQFSDAALSNAPGTGGPGAGDGGTGADRPDTTAPSLQIAGGIPNPGADPFGRRGGPVGRDVDLEDSGGGGGLRFPIVFPTDSPTIPPFVGGFRVQQVTLEGGGTTCMSFQVASGGAGGGYATDGRSAFPLTPVPLAEDGSENLPDHPASGGLSSAVGIEAPDPESGHNVRRLRSEAGHLRGGSGGGGGGAMLYRSETNAIAVPCTGVGKPIINYDDHSGASGGGGGGALQLVSGDTLRLSGKLLATGGNGGSAFATDNTDPLVVRQTRSAGGGGGSGGAVRLQGENVVLDLNVSDPFRVDVRGGFGGTNATLGIGGRGGHGLVRIEDTSGALTRASESPKIAPFVPGHINPATGLEESENVLSVGEWTNSRFRPESFSGSVSCWMKPAGNYFRLIFTEDDEPNGIFGWNMDVYYDAGAGELLLNYRDEDPNSPYPTPLEDVVGLQNGLNAPATQNCIGDYFSVRFQGARAITDVSSDPCGVIISGSNSQIEAGSLTPWVKHPAELNAYEPRVNMIRFALVFDGRMTICAGPANFIKGVTNLKILARPD